MSGQVIRQTERTAARKADGERRERIAGVQQCLVSHARLARMARAFLPASGRCPVRDAGWRPVCTINTVNRQMLHVYIDLVAAGIPAEQRYPGIAAHLRACGPCGEDFEALLAAVRDAAD